MRINKRLARARIVLAIGAASAMALPAAATTLRVVEYNVDDSDQGNNDNIADLTTVLQGIGNHHIAGNAQPFDVLGLTELLDTNNNSITSSTLPLLVTSLNNIYGAGTYAYDPDPRSDEWWHPV